MNWRLRYFPEWCSRVVSLLLVALAFGALSAPAQTGSNTTDNGSFTVYTYISADGGTIDASASDPQPDDPSLFTFFYDAAAPTWTLNGDNYYDSGLGSSFSSGPVPSGSTYTAQFNFFLFVYSSPDGCFYGDDSDECEGTTQQGYDSPTGYASVYIPSPPPQTLPADPCAITSDPKASFSSIVASAVSGGSGTLSISFSGSAFASISPTVTYGPNSTPSSIASHVAALITKNYAQYGLIAKALGSQIIYSGTSDLGSVSVNGGSSFGTDTSPTAVTAAANACYAIPSLPCGGTYGFFDYDTPRSYFGEFKETPREHIIRKHILGTASGGSPPNTVYTNPGGYSPDAMFDLVKAYNFTTYVTSKTRNPYTHTYQEQTLHTIFGRVDLGWIGHDVAGNDLHTNNLYLSADSCRVSTSFPTAP